MKQVNVVLVGIGGYGEIYVEEIFNSTNPLINLVGAVEPYPERSRYYDEFKKRNIPIYCSMKDFFKQNSADLTVISTPLFLHTEHIVEALNNNSNVLCEKPLCSDVNDIEIIRSAQIKSGKFVYIGYQWSYSDAITSLKRDIVGKKFGKLIEMKTLVLRPVNRSYFTRGVGWAGKIKTSDGKFVYDSIANNSAAHYLFNMLYVATDNDKVIPENLSAELLRANEIENFDVSKINFTLNDAKVCFIAAHPVEKRLEPVFEYRFEKGIVYYSCFKTDEACSLLSHEYNDYGNIVAVMNDGSKKVYGDPMADSCNKLHIAVKDAANGICEEGPCGIDISSTHTRLINKIQSLFDIRDVKEDYLKVKDNILYVDGLFEKALECYKKTDASIAEFAL